MEAIGILAARHVAAAKSVADSVAGAAARPHGGARCESTVSPGAAHTALGVAMVEGRV
jgi:hypothetical protein